MGIGSGLATTTVPLALAAIARPRFKQSLGVANQLSIVVGILAAQLLAFPLGYAYLWRGVPALAALLAALQLLWSLWISPISIHDDASFESQPLLDGAYFHGPTETGEPREQLTVPQLLACTELDVTRPRELTTPIILTVVPLVLITQLAQQISGTSAGTSPSASI